MFSRLRNLFKPELKTLNTLFISREKILHNLKFLKALQPQSAFFPVLKSNAYGHGILPMLEILKGQKFPYLAVDSFPEYQLIHKHSNFNTLMIWETLPENYRFFDFKRTAFAVYNLSTLHHLTQLGKTIRIHLFLNTGMNREGIQFSELKKLVGILKNEKQINLEGVMSHFHSADSNCISAKHQITTFKKMFSILEKNGFTPKWKHISASSGIFQAKDPFFTACRPWIAMYGYSPLLQKENWLQPALRLESTIVSLQSLSAWEGVSYNQKRKAEKPCKSATIPFGYYEGRLRSASGKLVYTYKNQTLPQIGTICMNLSSCLATEEMNVRDTIKLISDNAKAPNSIEATAQQAGTIPYEILIRLDKGIRRIVM